MAGQSKQNFLRNLLGISAIVCGIALVTQWTARKTLAKDSVTTNEKDGSVLISIAGETAWLGSTDDNLYNPPHMATLSPYLIGKFPVTNAQFRKFVEARSYVTDAERQGWAQGWTGSSVVKKQGASWRSPNGHGSTAPPDLPVVCVTFKDACDYCAWAGVRLPTDDEWEYACRGDDGRQFAWGNDWDAKKCCNSVAMVRSGPTPVGSYPLGDSPFGCQDMTGNVFQWTTNPQPLGGCVLRGGSWLARDLDFFCAAGRCYGSIQEQVSIDTGFRVAKTLPTRASGTGRQGWGH